MADKSEIFSLHEEYMARQGQRQEVLTNSPPFSPSELDETDLALLEVLFRGESLSFWACLTGMSRTVLYRRASRPVFRQALAEGMAGRRDAIVSQTIEMAAHAIDWLDSVLTDESGRYSFQQKKSICRLVLELKGKTE